MTADLARRLRALHEQATKGPWIVVEFKSDPPGTVRSACGRTPDDAALVVALRNAAPALIAALELAEAVDAMEASGVGMDLERAIQCDRLLNAYRAAREGRGQGA